jgi:hypothetical protein
VCWFRRKDYHYNKADRYSQVCFELNIFYCSNISNGIGYILQLNFSTIRDHIAGLSIFFKSTTISLLTHYFFIKIWRIFMNILYSTLKSGDIKDQFRRIKVPVPAPYWKAWHGWFNGYRAHFECSRLWVWTPVGVKSRLWNWYLLLHC